MGGLQFRRRPHTGRFQAVDDPRNELVVEKTFAAPGRPGYVIRGEDGRRVLTTTKWGFPTRKPRKRPAKVGELPFLYDCWTNAWNLGNNM